MPVVIIVNINGWLLTWLVMIYIYIYIYIVGVDCIGMIGNPSTSGSVA